MGLLNEMSAGSHAVTQTDNAYSPRMENNGHATLIEVKKGTSSNGYPYVNLTLKDDSGAVRSENLHFGYNQVSKVNELPIFDKADIAKFSKKVKDTLADKPNVKAMSSTWFNILQSCGVEYRDRVVLYVSEQMNNSWRMLNALLGNTKDESIIEIAMPETFVLDDAKKVSFTEFSVIADTFCTALTNCIGRVVHLKFYDTPRKNGYKDLRRVELVGDKMQDIPTDELAKRFTPAVAETGNSVIDNLSKEDLVALLAKATASNTQNQGLPVQSVSDNTNSSDLPLN